MGSEDSDRLVEAAAGRLPGLGPEDGGEGRSKRLADGDEIVHGDPAPAKDGHDPLGPRAEERGIVGGDDPGDDLEEALEIAIEGPEADLPEAVAEFWGASEGDLEGPEADLVGGTPEAFGVGRPAGAHVPRRQAESGVTHGREV